MDFDRPHRRKNILTGEWVLVSPHRAKRPWLGQVEKIQEPYLPAYDPTCYLCPGNPRAGGSIVNPDYEHTFVFDNDFAALYPADEMISDQLADGLLCSQQESGICRVVCFSPRHDLTIPELPLESMVKVIETWTLETKKLAAFDFVSYIQIFENKGAVMGCSNPHPHSQVWATGHIPDEPAKELDAFTSYYREHGSSLLADYLSQERADGSRIVTKNEHFTALVPFWAVWPFEILVISHRPVCILPDLTHEEKVSLADILQQVSTRYDNLFEISFPYSMGFHQAPVDGKEYPGWHFHAHYYPPLLRSATVKKFMVGFEMLGMPQRDITAELAAERLRSVPAIHFKKKSSLG